MPCMRALAALCSGGLCRDMRPPRWREWAGHESMRVKESLDAEADDVVERFLEVVDELVVAAVVVDESQRVQRELKAVVHLDLGHCLEVLGSGR